MNNPEFEQVLSLSRTSTTKYVFQKMDCVVFRLINHYHQHCAEVTSPAAPGRTLIHFMNHCVKHNWSLSDGAECSTIPGIPMTFSSPLFPSVVKTIPGLECRGLGSMELLLMSCGDVA